MFIEMCYYIGMKISITVHPNSKNPRIERDDLVLHVFVKEPPVDGKANDAVKRALAKHFGVAPSLVTLVHGGGGKRKVFELPTLP